MYMKYIFESAMSDGLLTKDAIRAALQEVIDPEVGVNVFDLGLIYEVWVGGGTVRVKMTMTTPACPMGTYITDSAKNSLRAMAPNISDVQVHLVWDPPWNPTMMSDEAKQLLGW